MRRAVRAIVIKDNNLLVMKRNKFGHEYYTLVGGRIEAGESPEQALQREVFEETGLSIKVVRQVYIEHAELPYGDQIIFNCDYVSGVPALRPDSEEALISKMGKNLYIPMWLPISELTKVPFKSDQLAAQLLKDLNQGFPNELIEFKS